MESLFAAAMQLGVGGIFACMWWIERRDKLAAEGDRKDKETRLTSVEADRAVLMSVVTENTEAITALTSEVHRWHTRSIPAPTTGRDNQ
jgi:hypothetical protein